MAMPSDELQLLMAGYVLGDLSPEEAAAFEQLLATDPTIAAEVAQLQTALETAYASPEVMPPEHLRSTILTQAEADHAGNIQRSPTRRPLPWRGWLEVVAAGLIVALGINNYRLQQALTRQATVPGTTLIYVLESTQTNSAAAAKVVVDPDELEATISAQNLPSLPPGKVYALWTVVQPDAPFTTDPKQAILTEVFQVDDRGGFTQTIVVPKAYRFKGLVTKVAVTIEDANAPQKHTGDPIMIAMPPTP
ncbi:anti-sigma factor [Pantanalinema rosaneae CENA516]|uniref:anti-sigma factor n=1 Tax=Pantanalinema rosaneae TaxID=1620701 RepID=UPI003D6DF432